ncbi:hypothetical protein PN4B1_11760 [Paenibacillus naphthalenovorans]|nr:hypothetical protein PN4B1_11760 [Paenibacillus naphthalenovorans]
MQKGDCRNDFCGEVKKREKEKRLVSRRIGGKTFCKSTVGFQMGKWSKLSEH